jgi:hypothetical protein
MKFNYKLAFFLLSTCLVILLGLVLPSLIDDKQELLPAEKNNFVENRFDFHDALKGVSSNSAKSTFPYTQYIKSTNYHDAKNIQSDLKILDSLLGDKMLVREIVSIALTDSLYYRDFSTIEKLNLDSLNYTLQWAEKFKHYGEADASSENQLLFQSIYDFWMSKIAKNLSEYSEYNSGAKFNFQFRYLTAKCNEKRYNVSVKVTSLEKVIQNLLGNKWAHLFEASWNQASLLQKVICGFMIVFTIVTYVFTLKGLFKSKK